MPGLSPLGAYGNQIAKCFYLNSAPSCILSSSHRSEMAVTRLRSESGLSKPTVALPAEKAFIIATHLLKPDCRGWGTWIDGRYHQVQAWPEGGIEIVDLESDPIALRPTAFDTVHYYLPRNALESFTDANDLKPVSTLNCLQGTYDSVMHHLSQMILPHLSNASNLPALFTDCFVQMLCGHIVETYSCVSKARKQWRGGLAPWQKRRTSELLRQHLDGDLRLARLAHECGLSVTHFARSFKASFGTTLHRYVLLERIETAKTLLQKSDQALVEIALNAGFSDQTTFCRTFNNMVGTTPGRWRRERRHNVFDADRRGRFEIEDSITLKEQKSQTVAHNSM